MMITELRFTLITDGSSDRAFVPILKWLLRENGVQVSLQNDWPDFRRLGIPPRGLVERVVTGLDLSPCDLLFVHRDAEREPLETRKAEIEGALAEARTRMDVPNAICVIPVRMLEAWLLFDERAIREAAENPHGNCSLPLPKPSKLEDLPDPKEILERLLIQASELNGRRLRQFERRLGYHKARVVEYIEDFSPLRQLSAFQALEEDIRQVIQEQGWDQAQ